MCAVYNFTQPYFMPHQRAINSPATRDALSSIRRQWRCNGVRAPSTDANDSGKIVDKTAALTCHTPCTLSITVKLESISGCRWKNRRHSSSRTSLLQFLSRILPLSLAIFSRWLKRHTRPGAIWSVNCFGRS